MRRTPTNADKMLVLFRGHLLLRSNPHTQRPLDRNSGCFSQLPDSKNYKLKDGLREGRVNPRLGEPPTGEPCAGDPPARFGGGRGRIQSALPPPIKFPQDLWNECRPCALTRRFSGIPNFFSQLLSHYTSVSILKTGEQLAIATGWLWTERTLEKEQATAPLFPVHREFDWHGARHSRGSCARDSQP